MAKKTCNILLVILLAFTVDVCAAEFRCAVDTIVPETLAQQDTVKPQAPAQQGNDKPGKKKKIPPESPTNGSPLRLSNRTTSAP